jgi:hypothetical protein
MIVVYFSNPTINYTGTRIEVKIQDKSTIVHLEIAPIPALIPSLDIAC